MNEWWKNPVLQGPDNEYGDYDYLIEDLPHDYTGWEFNKYRGICDSCGKSRHLLMESVHYFYTMDGYDYMDYNECLVCRLHSNIYVIKNKIKKRIQIVKDAWDLSRNKSTGKFKYWYNIIKQINR